MKKTQTQKTRKGRFRKKQVVIEEPPPDYNKKQLERFVYISTYNDSNLMSSLKNLFEEVNTKAFDLSSPKEVYTYELSQMEQNNNLIDYISGFQLIDKNIRITILEGITDKGMNKIKEYLPKNHLNTEHVKIFSNSNYLFDKRLYSKFGLSVKFIKLQKNLSDILQTYDIYEKAERYRDIYDTFHIFGSLLKVQSMKDIITSNLFPDVNKLLLLERKYCDLLTQQDITGVFVEKKKLKKLD